MESLWKQNKIIKSKAAQIALGGFDESPLRILLLNRNLEISQGNPVTNLHDFQESLRADLRVEVLS